MTCRSSARRAACSRTSCRFHRRWRVPRTRRRIAARRRRSSTCAAFESLARRPRRIRRRHVPAHRRRSAGAVFAHRRPPQFDGQRCDSVRRAGRRAAARGGSHRVHRHRTPHRPMGDRAARREDPPAARDLVTEASLPIDQRASQRRFTQLERFNIFLPPDGRVTLPGPTRVACRRPSRAPIRCCYASKPATTARATRISRTRARESASCTAARSRDFLSRFFDTSWRARERERPTRRCRPSVCLAVATATRSSTDGDVTTMWIRRTSAVSSSFESRSRPTRETRSSPRSCRVRRVATTCRRGPWPKEPESRYGGASAPSARPERSCARAPGAGCGTEPHSRHPTRTAWRDATSP